MQTMTGTAGKRLVFRLSGVGFSLAIADLLEILEAQPGTLDPSGVDDEHGLLGLVSFRDEAIHVRDIHGLLGLTQSDPVKAYLVVVGADGAWALPADQVEGFSPLDAFRRCAVPPLLQSGAPLPFAAIDLWQGEPLVFFEPMFVDQWQRMP